MAKSAVKPTVEDAVRERLGEKRLAGLSGQPSCLANGGIDEVIKTACADSAGHDDPVTSATVRVIILCGSTPSIKDLRIEEVA